MALADNPHAEALISAVHIYNLDRGSAVKYLRLDCPWCGDSKGHLHFYLDDSVSRCMRCGAWGRVGYLFRALGLPVPDRSALTEDYTGTFKEISARLMSGGLSNLNGHSPRGACPEIDLPEGTISFQFLDPHFRAHARVLARVTGEWRITLATALALKWQWNARLDSFIFPVFDSGEERERLVFWSARSFDGKFRSNAPHADLSAYGILGHFNHPLRKTAQEVYVVEGPRDAAALLQEDFFAVYLLGHNPGQRQIERLQALPQIKVLLLDSDVTEHAAAIAERLGWTILYLPQGDPGDYAGNLKETLAQAWLSGKSPLARRLSHIRQKLFTTQIQHH